MKTVTFIVKDSETGSVQKFNAKMNFTETRVVKGSLNGVSVSAQLPNGFDCLFGKESANDDE